MPFGGVVLKNPFAKKKKNKPEVKTTPSNIPKKNLLRNIHIDKKKIKEKVVFTLNEKIGALLIILFLIFFVLIFS